MLTNRQQAILAFEEEKHHYRLCLCSLIYDRRNDQHIVNDSICDRYLNTESIYRHEQITPAQNALHIEAFHKIIIKKSYRLSQVYSNTHSYDICWITNLLCSLGKNNNQKFQP